MSDTRIIVKNIPRYITPDRLKSHFIEKGDVIDVDIPKTKSDAFIKSRIYIQIEAAKVVDLHSLDSLQMSTP